MSRKHHLLDINIKNILYICSYNLNLNYISYQIVWINKIYLYVCNNLIIYVIVTGFLIVQYIFIIL